MIYKNSLQALRQEMLSRATKQDVAPIKGIESFIPARDEPKQVEETPEDIMARSATWLSEIKKASSEFKRQYNEVASRKASVSPAEALLTGYMDTRDSFKKAEKEEDKTQATRQEAREAFISRRSEGSPSTYASQRPFETPVPVDAEMPNVLDALAAVESKGSGDYEAVGPLVTKGMYKNQRAYGRYQVMEGNIGPWTKAALGRSYTTEEFMADPQAQDTVAAHQLQMAKDKFGTWEDAASVWFSGRPMSKAGNASDGYLTTPEYINKFRRNFKRS
jgi:hypothetical protein